MSEYFKDDLNAFFKSKLTKTEPAENGWNIPPDDVFNDAILHLDAVKRTRFLRNIGVFSTACAVLAALVLGWMYFDFKENTQTQILQMNQQMELLEKKSEAQQNEIALLSEQNTKLQAESSALKKSENKSLNTRSINNEIASVPVVDRVRQSEAILAKNKNITSSENGNINGDSVVNAKGIEIENTDGLNKTTISTEVSEINSVLPSESRMKIREYNTMPTLRSFFLVYSRDESSIDIGLMDYEFATDTDQSFNKNWSLASYAGLNFSSLSMNVPVGGSTADLREYDNLYLGLSSKIQLERNFGKRFHGAIHLGFSKINNRSTNIDSKGYSKSSEWINQNGETIYIMDMDMESPLGIMTRATDFSVDGLTDAEKDMFMISTDMRQSMDVVSAGIGLYYDVLQFNKFDLFVGSSWSYNYIEHNFNQFHSSIEMSGKKMNDTVLTSSEMQNTSKSYTTLGVEMGMDFRIKQNVSFSVLTGFTQGMSSLRKQLLPNDATTTIRQFNIQFGIKKSF